MMSGNCRDNTTNCSRVLSVTLVVLFVALIASRLAVNAILNPMGIELQQINTEKTAIAQESAQIEKDIAQRKSLLVLKTVGENELQLNQQNRTDIVITAATNLTAQR